MNREPAIAGTPANPRLGGYESDEPPLPLLPGSYQELREQGPVCWHDAYEGFWILWGYREVRDVLADPGRFSSRYSLQEALLGEESSRGVGAIPLNLDPPLHGEYRQLLARLIAMASRRAGKSLAQSVVDEVLKTPPRDDALDFTRSFAIPVTAKVLFRFIGFPPEEEAMFLEHTQSFVRSRRLSEPGRDAARVSLLQLRSRDLSWAEESWMHEYVRHRVAGSRRGATNGLMGLLMSTDWRTHFGSRIDEATSMLLDFIQAGLVNTPVALRNGVGHLMTNRDHREVLLGHPALAPRMADELLRLYPLAFPVRTVRRDVVVAGVKLHVGEVVMPLVGMANRDATVFEQPDQVLLNRPNGRKHLAFGAGPHFCIGATIAHEILTASFASIDQMIRRYELLAG